MWVEVSFIFVAIFCMNVLNSSHMYEHKQYIQVIIRDLSNSLHKNNFLNNLFIAQKSFIVSTTHQTRKQEHTMQSQQTRKTNREKPSK